MLSETHSDGMAGVVLGGAYQLVGCIGQGGMGAVYEAHHLRLQKRVAVKLMNRTMAKSGEALARFHREASVASRIGHPHLVNVMDFGASDHGEPYLVMEFLEGEDLDRRIRRAGRVPLATAVEITRQVASALGVVHAKGIVHRDLKPANVFLVQVPGEPDFVKVLDFGVSKMKTAGTKLTADCNAVGTPKYMSPEQASASNDEVDHRADQWALACIAWEMLSGSAPFDAADVNALFYQLINFPPAPLSASAPELPAAVENVLLRALSKRPADRYPSVREFARALQAAALGTWSELTPMPFACVQSELARQLVADAIPGGVLVEGRPQDGSAPAAKPRGRRLGLATVGLAVGLLVSGAGLLLANARTATSGGAPTVTTAPATAPVVTALPIGPPTSASRGKSPVPTTPKTAPRPRTKAPRLGATPDPFSDESRGRHAPAKRTSALGAAGYGQAGLPPREQHIFEDL